MTACWIGVYTKLQAEGRAELGIRAARIPVFCPWERRQIKFRNGERPMWRITPILPRYVFAQCDRGRSHLLTQIDGVESLLRRDGKISPIPDDFIDAFEAAQGAGVFDRFEDGEIVRVKAGGPYAGLIAKIGSAKPGKRIRLMVDFIHNLTISVDRVERVSA